MCTSPLHCRSSAEGHMFEFQIRMFHYPVSPTEPMSFQDQYNPPGNLIRNMCPVFVLLAKFQVLKLHSEGVCLCYPC
uniref:Uncharacterized protein n=1 Tax=Anguilla anguilla TaxID=7936 RepID=A0A0E9PJT0_ANGAN